MSDSETNHGSRTECRNRLISSLSQSIPVLVDSKGDIIQSQVEKLLEIYECIADYLLFCNPTIREKVVLLIDQIIIMDKLVECGEGAWDKDNRHTYMHDLLDSLSEFRSCSTSLDLKESVFYYTGCLCFKVHNYKTALELFQDSNDVCLQNTAGNELTEKQRISRYIFIAFCYEYIGDPEAAIKYLLGITSIDIFEVAILKHKLEIILAMVSTEAKKDKYRIVKNILKFPEFSNNNILKKLLPNGTLLIEFEDEVIEIIHVLAHCLSEYRSKAETEYNKEQQFDRQTYTNLIILLSTKLIDILSDQNFVTCKAIIRAEGRDLEGALEILPPDNLVQKEEVKAEINFYRFYFAELFSGIFPQQANEEISDPGEKFKDYCNLKLDNESKYDALLHYHIFEVKRQLRTKIENIIRNTNNRNGLFFALNLDEGNESWKESYLAVTQKTQEFNNGFSSFANEEIKKELKLLHICLNILIEMKTNKLPLFLSNDEADRQLVFETSGNQLLELCKMFSSLIKKSKRPIIQSYNTQTSKYRTYYINDLKFDVLGDDYSVFDYWIQKYFDVEQIDYVYKENLNLTNTTKIVFGDNSEVVTSQCLDYYQKINLNSKMHIRVFYTGVKNEKFIARPIVGFDDIQTCILLAFIYATIELVIDYICKPEPIYILAPLRNTGSYYFQAVNHDKLISLHNEKTEEKTIDSEGIGIFPWDISLNKKMKIPCRFGSETLLDACSCAIVYKKNILYVLRNKNLVEKTNVNCQLIEYYYSEYAKSREVCRKCIDVHENTLTNCMITGTRYCDYVFRRTDSLHNLDKEQNSKAKNALLELIVIACKENVEDYDNLYVLENSLIEYGLKEMKFMIFMFNKKINFSGCCKDWVSFEEDVKQIVPISIAQYIDKTNHVRLYRDHVETLCNELESERRQSHKNWTVYKADKNATEKDKKICDRKITALECLEQKISDLRLEWLLKIPENQSKRNSLQQEFDSGQYAIISSVLKENLYIVGDVYAAN